MTNLEEERDKMEMIVEGMANGEIFIEMTVYTLTNVMTQYSWRM